MKRNSMTKEDKPIEGICRYCNRNLSNMRIIKRGNIHVGYCNHCDSEQSFYEDGKPREWSFMVGKKYCIHYWPESKALKIVEYNAHGQPSKYVVEATVKEDPDYMTPDSMTEERIKTIVVFS